MNSSLLSQLLLCVKGLVCPTKTYEIPFSFFVSHVLLVDFSCRKLDGARSCAVSTLPGITTSARPHSWRCRGEAEPYTQIHVRLEEASANPMQTRWGMLVLKSFGAQLGHVLFAVEGVMGTSSVREQDRGRVIRNRIANRIQNGGCHGCFVCQC